MRTLVAIPVFNEQKYVGKVLSEVRRYVNDILVIDDGSTDETPLLLARQPVEVIRHARNRGYGRSIIDALRYAQCQCCTYDWLITMDCDEQHEPAALPDFFRAILETGADVISGSRYMPPPAGRPIGDRPPPDRQAINQTMTHLINERLGMSITDAFCGFKAVRVEAMRKLDLRESGYAFPMQFWVQVAARGLRVLEIPVRLIYNDPNRSFGGPLDNPELRLKHYMTVFNKEFSRFPDRFHPAAASSSAHASASATVAAASPSPA